MLELALLAEGAESGDNAWSWDQPEEEEEDDDDDDSKVEERGEEIPGRTAVTQDGPCEESEPPGNFCLVDLDAPPPADDPVMGNFYKAKQLTVELEQVSFAELCITAQAKDSLCW